MSGGETCLTEKQNREEWEQKARVGLVIILSKVVRKGLSDDVIFEQTPEERDLDRNF